jgi:hypothetical protein
LGENQLPVADHLMQTKAVDAGDNLIGAQGAFAGGAPDIDAPGVNDQQPGVDTTQAAAQGIEGELVVGGDQNRRLRAGRPHGIETGGDCIVAAGQADAGADGAPDIRAASRGCYLRDRTGGSFDKTTDKGTENVARPFVDPGPGFRFWASAGGGGRGGWEDRQSLKGRGR